METLHRLDVGEPDLRSRELRGLWETRS